MQLLIEQQYYWALLAGLAQRQYWA
jgi:hypothetical protein